jgi:CheY-like chemotaxis protein
MAPCPRILMVEDHPDHRFILRHQLGKLCPVEVLETPDGQQALELITSGAPVDLIIMDLKLPGYDGWETTRRIRALPSLLSGIPILAYTAYTTATTEQEALAAGCDDYLIKPLRDVSVPAEGHAAAGQKAHPLTAPRCVGHRLRGGAQWAATPERSSLCPPHSPR